MLPRTQALSPGARKRLRHNQNANAIRFGTLYNFRFDADQAPNPTNATVGFFKTGSPMGVPSRLLEVSRHRRHHLLLQLVLHRRPQPRHTNPDGNCDSYATAQPRNANSDCDRYAYGDPDSNSAAYSNAQRYSDTEAQAYSASAPVME